MRRRNALSALLIMAAAGVVASTPAIAGEHHVMMTPPEIEWQPAPASVPEGAEMAVLYGSPGEEGLFALRLRMPDGYHIPPHTHPRPEVVTVLSGTFRIGMGEAADRDQTQALEAGSFFAFAPGMAHFAYTEGETVIQLNSIGPWGLDYVDPADDPRPPS
jgi:quercetin dioxygenase-like cupin family protein